MVIEVRVKIEYIMYKMMLFFMFFYVFVEGVMEGLSSIFFAD